MKKKYLVTFFLLYLFFQPLINTHANSHSSEVSYFPRINSSGNVEVPDEWQEIQVPNEINRLPQTSEKKEFMTKIFGPCLIFLVIILKCWINNRRCKVSEMD